MSTYLPFVAILTPVYNGEKYLAECIDSVRSQLFKNWEYIIVNNCSTDSTLDIAARYANIDPRICIVNNSRFVDVVENHNIAFSLISQKSKYCKVVSADDWITPDCIKKLVNLAEAHPTVDIVGSYQLSNTDVRWKGLPENIEIIPGREVCRLSLLDNLDVFGNPTSSLYRSDLIRKSKRFFRHPQLHADTSAYYDYLQHCNYGFVHEILSVQRIHDQQVTSTVRRLNMGSLATLEIVLEYGPIYLTAEELEILKGERFAWYYRLLGGCVLKLKGREFWQYHASRMKELGYPIAWRKVIKGTIDEIADEIQNPRVAFQKLFIVLKEKYCDLLQGKW